MTKAGVLEVENLPSVDRDYEVAYNSVFAARVLGAGLSWVAMQEGRLLRAEHLARTAQSILTGTGQESLKLLMESILLLAIRRRSPLGSKAESDALRDLEGCYAKFAKCGDVPGQFRCASELVRGHLDHVEFGQGDRKASLSAAERWLATSNKVSDPRKTLRCHLQEARYLLLSGNVAGAHSKISKKPGVRLGLAINDNANEQAEVNISWKNMAASIYLEQQQTHTARTHLESSMDPTFPDTRNTKRSIDPVLDAECCLFARESSAARRRYQGRSPSTFQMGCDERIRAEQLSARHGPLTKFLFQHPAKQQHSDFSPLLGRSG